MPRINIEDQFWIDIGDVAAKIGDHQRAVGMALIFFRLAQERFKDGKVMSEQEFFAEGFSEALIPKFAIRTERGIEAKGGAKHFKWLADSNDFMKSIGKKGGLISSMRPRDEKGHFLPHPDDDVQASKRSPSVTQAAWTETSTNVQASKPSSSSSSSKDLKEKLKNDPEWAQFWANCPRKVAKGKAMESWIRCRKSYTPEDIARALGKLKAEKTKSGESYPYPATFLNNLGDFLEPDYGSQMKLSGDEAKRRSF